MKNLLLLSTAITAVLCQSAFADDLTVSGKVSGPLKTSTANTTAGDITITSAGTVELVGSGAAVTIDSSNDVTNSGNISVSGDLSGTGVALTTGFTGNFTNLGNLTVKGSSSSTSTEMLGVLVSGNGTYTGNILTGTDSTISVTGLSAADIAIRSAFVGNVTLNGTLKATGLAASGVVSTNSITGAFINRGSITTTGGGTDTSLLNLSGGPAVALGGSVTGGILNGGPLSSVDTTAPAIIGVDGSSPAFMIAPSLGNTSVNVAVGVLTDATNSGYSFINRGNVTAITNQPGIGATAMQIGNLVGDAGTATTTFNGGIYNRGVIAARATSDNGNATAIPSISTPAVAMVFGVRATVPTLMNDTGGVISATSGGPAGGSTTAITIHSTASLQSITNRGSIVADANTTDTGGMVAFAIQDGSGTLTSITNSGTISATITRPTGVENGVAADLSAATGAITFNNTGTVVGDLRFGNSTANALTVDGGNASVSGKITTAGGGKVNITLSNGGDLDTIGVTRAGTLTAGAGSNVNLGVGTATTIISAANNVTFDANSHITITPVSMLPGNATITLVHSDQILSIGNTTTSTIAIPFLFNGTVTHDAHDLTLAVQRKTAAQIGLSGNDAAIYEPAMAAAVNDAELGTAISQLGSADEVQAALDQLLPTASLATRSMVRQFTDPNANALGARQQLLTLGPREDSGVETWAQGIYQRFDDDSATGFEGKATGAAVGIDYHTGRGHIGIAFTGLKGDADDKGLRPSGTEMEFYTISPYAGFRSADVFLNLQVNAGTGNINSQRSVTVGTVSRTVSGKTTATYAAGGVTGGYIIDAGGFQIAPQVGVNGLYLGTGDYSETGGGTGVNLSVADQSQSSMSVFIGVAGVGTYDNVAGGRLTPQFLGGYNYEVVSTSNDLDLTFQAIPGSGFSISGPTEDRSRFVGALGLAYGIAGWSLNVGYNASVASDTISQAGQVTLGARF